MPKIKYQPRYAEGDFVFVIYPDGAAPVRITDVKRDGNRFFYSVIRPDKAEYNVDNRNEDEFYPTYVEAQANYCRLRIKEEEYALQQLKKNLAEYEERLEHPGD